MQSDVWPVLVGGIVVLAALALAAFAVARMSRTAPVKAAVVITALAGFLAALPPLIAAFAALRS
ncbi:hypothetical protein P3T36_002936 [Kitasatospora sp. MAP12-15]|uniref:hypothetical protein n=1 Tax=unclassified Kitasatospora TaxID=2633591 RepID=UPI0024737148|nr:hypothetical protein [Kitasatospora sp. MAP12-44]MDH6114115.1 hypothetical protein [Kitasatospora sp. MAP12-44]